MCLALQFSRFVFFYQSNKSLFICVCIIFTSSYIHLAEYILNSQKYLCRCTCKSSWSCMQTCSLGIPPRTSIIILVGWCDGMNSLNSSGFQECSLPNQPACIARMFSFLVIVQCSLQGIQGLLSFSIDFPLQGESKTFAINFFRCS